MCNFAIVPLYMFWHKTYDMNNVLFIIVAILLFAGVIYLRCNRANIQGWFGEKNISSRLHTLSDDYVLFNDVYINVGGRSVQIDHIVVSIYGIFVIETKNYKGWIYGTDNSEYWTNNIFGNKYQFYNPIKQNYSHVWALEKLLKIPENKFIPIVVFLGGATLKCDTQGVVIYSGQLRQFILNYKMPVFSQKEVADIANILTSANNIDKSRKKAHIHSVRQGIAEKNTLIRNGVCPRCRGKLVERKGKYGRFYGCSNYPQCKFTMPL